MGYEYSLHWLNTQSPGLIEEHIPLPSMVGLPAPTPRSFGHPLKIEGYKNRSCSWLLLNLQRVCIPFGLAVFILSLPLNLKLTMGMQWKRFDPPVYLSDSEGARLVNYSQGLYRNRSQSSEGNPTPAGLPPPAMKTTSLPAEPAARRSHWAATQPRPGPTTSATLLQVLVRTIGRVVGGLVLGFGDDDLSEDGDYEVGDGVTPIKFARIWAPQNPRFAKIVDDYELKERQMKQKSIIEWASGIPISKNGADGAEPVSS